MLRKIAALAFASACAVSGGVAFADGARILSESDTGVVFGDLDCQIIEHKASAPRLHEGAWGYLYAYVEVETTCLTIDGRRWTSTDGDDVWLPTVTWDRREQAWKQNGVAVAKRIDFRTLELNPDLTYETWTSADDAPVAFKVHVKTQPD